MILKEQLTPARMIQSMVDPLATEADSLRRNAAAYPDHIATIYRERRTSYGDFNCRASQVANGLLRLDSCRQERVGFLAKNSDLFFEVLFGIAKAGKVSLPINWRLAAREIAFVVTDANVQTLFIDPEFEAVLPELKSAGVELGNVFIFDKADGKDDYATWRDRQDTADPFVSVAQDDIFIQMYTSGTTGMPKGAQITHGSSMRMRTVEVSTKEPWTDWSHNDVALVQMPNFHVAGTSWAMQWFSRGATCVVQKQVNPAEIVEAIARFGVTQIFAVPTVIAMMLEEPATATCDFSRLRTIYYGAAPITPPLINRALASFDCDFVQLYGMTETNGVVACLSPEIHKTADPELLKSCGRPYPLVGIRIMDPTGKELPQGQVGEVCIDTPALMKGYWKLPNESAGSMFGRYYRSGDAGYFNKDGYLFLVDRIKDMIITGGENVYPIEVERVLAEHRAVRDVAVIGVPDSHWGEAVKGLVVSSDPSLTADELIEFLKGKIARFKTPKTIEFLDELPRNPSGKVLKRELRKRYANL